MSNSASGTTVPCTRAGSRLRTVRTVADLRTELGAATGTVALVPTMGALHAGHAALIEAARAECDVVVVSLFVNPTQFDDPADLRAYPRAEAHDAIVAAEAGADLLFAPSVDEMYPGADGSAKGGRGDRDEGGRRDGGGEHDRGGQVGTVVSVLGPSTETLEGAHRPGHFDGVATVVTKLLCAVEPDVAFFGAKDAQQTVVVRRLVRDLHFDVRIRVCPTVREPDGLALSSRNARLSPDERRRAAALWAALSEASRLAAAGERDATRLISAARERLRDLEVDYVALVDPLSFVAVDDLSAPALMAVAARVGATRLIDNHLIVPQESE